MEIQDLSFLSAYLVTQASDLPPENLSFILELIIGFVQLYALIFKKHAHASDFLLEELLHMHCLMHQLLHLILFNKGYRIHPLKFILHGLQIPD